MVQEELLDELREIPKAGIREPIAATGEKELVLVEVHALKAALGLTGSERSGTPQLETPAALGFNFAIAGLGDGADLEDSPGIGV